MIPISKKEKMFLAEQFPEYIFPRTMRHDSHRHHYFCVESEELVRAISDSNDYAAELVKQYDQSIAYRGRNSQRQNRAFGGNT